MQTVFNVDCSATCSNNRGFVLKLEYVLV